MPSESIRNIAVFRALQLGDLLCTVPAMRALRAAYPAARITLIGLPWAADFVRRFPYVDELMAFPGFPGLPEREPDLDALPDFFIDAQMRQFDLAIQMHGSGGIVNLIVGSLGAKAVFGYRPDPAAVPAHFPVWPTGTHEILIYLQLMEAMGIASCGTALEFPIHPPEREELAAVLATESNIVRPYVCVHAGARLPSRRWPVDAFAAVADAIADLGFEIVLTGSGEEREIGETLQRRMRHPARNLVGRTSMGASAALVAEARLVVCNDTGISHIATAVGTPSVVVSSGADVRRWAPLDTGKHPVLWRDVPCRPCAYHTCPTEHECARGVTVAEVTNTALRMLRQHSSLAA
ncbi:MAG TPA: glycosyltransferase family 9 protein [Burkholderiales bacterium]|nr:glycosyltransferase family 9 protein [Burkholderiales bacterium]